MELYDDILRFSGTFRPFQQRVLDNSDTYLKDGKLHIVAAPGSGKTTLGIELIRRLGLPALVISPRLVIRDQWLHRIQEAFLLCDPMGILSSDLRKPGLITSITYQTLFCAATRFRGTARPEDEDTDDEAGRSEAVDFSDLDLMATVKKAGIKVLCLDECHHLRAEWWQALESFLRAMEAEDVTVIALTATPPYDASAGEWARYTALCGPVDEEISVPELVARDCLCPHQDYVMLSAPTEKERAVLSDFAAEADRTVAQLLADDSLKAAVRGHRGLTDYDGAHEAMLEDPAYLSSLLIYLKAAGAGFDRRWTELLGASSLPAPTAEWTQTLLQGFLYDDRERFPVSEEYREHLENSLKRRGLIQRRQVELTGGDKLKKLMAGSLSKLDSVRRIAEAEYAALGGDLRMLVLADYIRREYMPALGDPEEPLPALGVVPLFESLRRALSPDCHLGVLCGGLVILPESALPALETAAGAAEVSVRPLTDPAGASIGYAQVSLPGKNSDIVRLVTALFEAGQVELLIGTKALLGEGYDAPCVNSLVLASFVGSFVLCNQMRGRAIRIDPDDPQKTANIWHLVCVDEPERASLPGRVRANPPVSADYETFLRRMDAFVGVSYDGERIESGADRLGVLRRPFTEANIERMNRETLTLAADRARLRRQWESAVETPRTPEMTEECAVAKTAIRSRATVTDVLGPLALYLLALTILLRLGGSGLLPVFTAKFAAVRWIFAAGLGFMTMKHAYQLMARLSPARYMGRVGKAVLSSLRELGEITSDCRVRTDAQATEAAVYLSGATAREKELFAQCVAEFFAPVENQRYLLRLDGRQGLFRYFCVPAPLARRREDAERFVTDLGDLLGKCRLIYTRNPAGRQELLRARTLAWANVSQEVREALAGRRKKKMIQELR